MRRRRIGFPLQFLPTPAQAATPELRMSLARLNEALDAGLDRADLRTQRVQLGAKILV